MMPLFRLALLVGTSAVAACGFLSGPQSAPSIPLLPPGDFPGGLQISQRVTVTAENSESTFLAAWTTGDGRLDFVGLTPSGQRLLTLAYDGREFFEEYSPLLEESVPGRDVLAQLQLAHWPLDGIQGALAGTEWRLEDAAGERRLFYRGRAFLTISTHAAGTGIPEQIRIESHVAPIRLTVETLDVVKR